MTSPGRNAEDSFPIDLAEQIDALCDEFETAWKANQSLQVEDFVNLVPEIARLSALRELITREVGLRRAAGEPVDAGEYLGRFADARTVVEAAFESLAKRPSLGETASFATGAAGTDKDGEAKRPEGVLEEIPERIGRYVILSVLGRGGFGVVYLAYDSDLDRWVALKVPWASRFTSPEELESYIAEARTAAQLEYPGIVPVYDVLRDADRVVIVQKYIDGQDLSRLVRSGPVKSEQAAKLMAAIAEAIAFAHEKGFVHRDLKPSNILLDEDMQAYVADFGLAIHESVQRRRRGERSGTPNYMSPEQVRGETHRLDGRSDIWSLGVILYE